MKAMKWAWLQVGVTAAMLAALLGLVALTPAPQVAQAGIVRAIVDADCDTSMNLSDAKVQHRYSLTHSQTGTVATTKQYLRIVKGATGTIRAIQAAITETIATGADRTVTLDLQKSTGGGAFATVLSSTIVFNNGSTLYTVSTGTISSNAVQAGDILVLTVTVAGSAGNQALGLVVSVTLAETPT